MKNFNFFEKLWEHSRTLRRVGLVLVMCLISITQAWAAASSLYAGDRLYVNCTGWLGSGAKIKINLYGTNGTYSTYKMAEQWDGDVYYIDIEGTYNGFQICRLNPDNLGQQWNHTGVAWADQRSDNDYNMIEPGYMYDNDGESPISWKKRDYTLTKNKYIYYDNHVTGWTTPHVRIGKNSYCDAPAMTRQAGTANYWYYKKTDSNWSGYHAFTISDGAGWTKSNNVFSSNDVGSRTIYWYESVSDDITIIGGSKGGTVTNPSPSTDWYNATKSDGQLTYTVTWSTTNGTISVVKYNDDAGASTTSVSSGGTVLPTQYIKITSTPSSGYYQSGPLTVTNATRVSEGVYYITGNCTISATYTAVPTTGTIYKFNVNTSAYTSTKVNIENGDYPLNTGNYLSTLIGGGLDIHNVDNKAQISNAGIYLNDNAKAYLTVKLGRPICEGDNIKWTVASDVVYMATTPTKPSSSSYNNLTTATSSMRVVEGNPFIGVSTIYLFKKNSVSISYFEVERGASITLNAHGGTGAPDAVYAFNKDKVVLPHAFKDGYHFKGWYTDASGGTKKDNYYEGTGTNITLHAQYDDCISDGTLFSMALVSARKPGAVAYPPKSGSMNLLRYADIDGGAAWACNTSGSDCGGVTTTPTIQSNNSNAYVKVQLDCALESGDQITINGLASNSVWLSNSTTRPGSAPSGTTATVAAPTITCDGSNLTGKTFYVYYGGGSATYTGITITRPAAPSCSAPTSPSISGTADYIVGQTLTLTASCESGADASTTYTWYKGDTWGSKSQVQAAAVAGSNGNKYTKTAAVGDAGTYWCEASNGSGCEAHNSTGNAVTVVYKVTYNNNGGSGTISNSTGTSITLSNGTGFTAPDGYTFDGWNTAADGSGIGYTSGQTGVTANLDLYARWKQTVTLKTGAQGSGADQTPYVYINGTGVSDFTPHTASGYTLQGYYTVGSGGVKVLNADGSFAAANVTDYITSGKWSRTGAAPTLFAQWVASEDCSTSDFVIRKGDDKEYQGCMESSSYNGTATSFTAGSPTTVGKAKMTISNYDGGIKRPGSGNTFSIVIEPVSGYYLKSVCWAGKVEDDDEPVYYYWDENTAGKAQITPTTTTGTGVTYNAPSSTTEKFTVYYEDSDGDDKGGIWWRNVQVEVCAAGGTTYSVTYNDNGKTGGNVPTDATNYSYSGTVTVLGNTGDLAKTNYTFAGWTTNNNGTGSSYEAGSTFSITDNTTLYAKWTQSVTLNKNGGSTDGSATAVWNATGLTGITHAKPAAGYKLLGYYSASSDGTKVLNSDGSFAATNVTGYITSGKWSRTSATTLYAQYESAGALIWNLSVNTDATSLTTSSKTSAFTEISTSNMSNATVNGVSYEKSKKSSLTGQISTPSSYNAGDYVYVTFQVASGYKFTPSSVSVKVQPVGEGEDKSVKLSLTDASESLVSASATKCDGTTKGKTTTVTLAGDGTEFTGTVTLKIYVYNYSGSSTANNCYRLGTPITIEGEIEEACGTMPSYTSMSYTTTSFLPDADASGSPITIVGGTNIDTYQWKYNTTNDRTSGTNCGTGPSLDPLTDVASGTTRYYWCEMTNTSCGITIKSPAVAITVAAAKSDATVEWTDPATPNYGGGGYTIKAMVNQTGWDGNAADLVITAPAGIRIYNVTSGTTSNQKWVQADFDVQTSFDRTTYASNIPFTVSAAATATYNAISDDHNVSYSACSGGGVGSSYKIRVRKSYDKDANNNYRWVTPGAGEITYAVGSSISSGKAGTAMATYFDSIMSSDKQYIWVKTFVGNIKQMRLYVETSGANISVSALYQRTTYAAADAKDVITGYSVVYDEDDDAENTGTKGQHTIDLIFTSALSANDIICVKFSSSKVKALGAAITEGSAGSLNTHLQWSGGLLDNATVAKYTTDAYFTYSASKVTENTNTLGAITYSSSDPSVATVDATGKVALIAAGETTIKATLAASGCYKKAEISYTLNVTEVACAITAGTLTLTSGTETKCEDDEVTLTLTGFESDASIQWKDGDTNINNGGNYTIETDGTTSTLTTNQEGTYSVMVTKDCSVRSNRITISNKSTEVGAKRIVKNWYIKNGRPTPDIELWTLQNGAHLSSVAWDPVNATGLTASDFYESDGKVYLKGKEPSSNASGADITYTLTLTVADDCGSTTAMSASGQLIYLHHQKNTDKHVLAFVVTGTEKGGFTEGITADQTTSVELYNTIAANFDVLATNVYSTDDEQALKEYYSQFDILCVTDYPNTGTKGVNKKSYVDALGALVDIRPILTMEAFVAKLVNWKAKGISGTPQSPTTRQYSMLLQCKDHEIFSGTELTKVGEGDETMYRVSMVDNTLEDYVTLDATYGGGEHAEKSGYEYGSKPALQGFTFTKEMLDDDLLPLGLIDDGSGNDLQVGIERQTEMEARLMVLGINSYAMERLTDDGQTVVVNALKYLMKKNSEDIADCSNTFVGGDDEEDESTRYNWNVASHWSGNAVPDRTQKVRIVAPCVIPANVKPHVAGVIIAPSGKYNHGANTASGSLTIAAGGALIVDGKVEAATAPLYTEIRATSPSDLILQTNSTAQSALIFDNDKGETQATVVVHSSANKDGSTRNWQYLTSPLQETPVTEFFYGVGTYTYKHSEADGGWVRYNLGTAFNAFDAIGLTQEAAKDFVFYGPLAPTGEWNLSLTHAHSGNNLFGNSWTAPIDLKALVNNTDFDSNIELDLAIYNTGTDHKNGAGEFDQAANADNTPGTWHHVPLLLATLEDAGWEGMTVIPAYQAFQLKATAAATLTIDYDKCVRGSESKNYTEPLRSPGHRAAGKSNSDIEALRLAVSDAKGIAYIYLLEGEQFSEEYDNGWELEYKPNSKYGKLYAISPAQGDMMALARPSLEGTMVGFQPGESSEYTITFNETDGYYYLNDLKMEQSTLIQAGESYTFSVEEGESANRFLISSVPFNKPGIVTGVTNPNAEAPKAQKVIYNDKLYIIRGGKVFSADGQLVK